MLHSRVLALALGGLMALSAAGCAVEDRTPRGSRRDEDAIQHLISQYARRLSAHDWTGVRGLFWREATYAGSMGPGAPSGFRLVVPVDSALGALARSVGDAQADRYDVRVIRTDLRQEGDLAAAWVTIRRRTPVGTTTVERDWVEHLVLRRVGGEWRLLSVAATQWPRRR
jgi:hypothetical protein